MKVKVSKSIDEIYKECHRNYDYAIESIINGFDPKSCEKAMAAVQGIRTIGDSVEVEISDDIITSIKEMMNRKDVSEDIIELLLWMGAVFPEI